MLKSGRKGYNVSGLGEVGFCVGFVGGKANFAKPMLAVCLFFVFVGGKSLNHFLNVRY